MLTFYESTLSRIRTPDDKSLAVIVDSSSGEKVLLFSQTPKLNAVCLFDDMLSSVMDIHTFAVGLA